MTAFLIGLFLGSCLTAGAFILWGWRAMQPLPERDDSDGARGIGA